MDDMRFQILPAVGSRIAPSQPLTNLKFEIRIPYYFLILTTDKRKYRYGYEMVMGYWENSRNPADRTLDFSHPARLDIFHILPHRRQCPTGVNGGCIYPDAFCLRTPA